jgi:hypothetical protein
MLSIEADEEIDLSDIPQHVCVYHRALIIEAGLATGMISESGGMPNAVVIHRLTWEGHEYLDAVRGEDVWEKTKSMFRKEGLSMTFDLVKTVAIKIATDLIFR